MVALVASGCGDDEPTNIEPSNELIGTWELRIVVYSNCADPDNNVSDTFSCPTQDCITWEFREGGVLVSTDTFEGDSNTSTGTYSIDGNSLTVTLDGETNTGTFSTTGVILIYNLRDEEQRCDLVIRLDKVN